MGNPVETGSMSKCMYACMYVCQCVQTYVWLEPGLREPGNLSTVSLCSSELV